MHHFLHILAIVGLSIVGLVIAAVVIGFLFLGNAEANGENPFQ